MVMLIDDDEGGKTRAAEKRCDLSSGREGRRRKGSFHSVCKNVLVVDMKKKRNFVVVARLEASKRNNFLFLVDRSVFTHHRHRNVFVVW